MQKSRKEIRIESDEFAIHNSRPFTQCQSTESYDGRCSTTLIDGIDIHLGCARTVLGAKYGLLICDAPFLGIEIFSPSILDFQLPGYFPVFHVPKSKNSRLQNDQKKAILGV